MDEQVVEYLKLYLMKANEQGESIYDLLVEYVLAEQEKKISGKNLKEVFHSIRKDVFKNDHSVPDNLWKKKQDSKEEIFNAKKKISLFLKRLASVDVEHEEKQKLLAELDKALEKISPEDQEKLDEIKKKKAAVHKSEISNVIEEASIFEFASVGLSDQELYSISVGINQLAHEKKMKKLRFFGKIFGLHQNYIICESEYFPADTPIQQPSEGELPAEEPGVGANLYTYWVCSTPGSSWTRLPDILPEHITTARKIHKYFTGNLEHSINSYPNFNGKEKHLLRAQIARITAATSIAPKGSYIENPPEEPAEDGQPKSTKPRPPFIPATEYEAVKTKDLINIENWIHIFEHIKKTGRCTVYKPPKPPKKEGEDGGEEEPAEEEPPAEAEGDPDNVPKLRGLQDDIQLTQPDGEEKKKKKPAAAEGEELPAEDPPAEDGAAEDPNNPKPNMLQKKIPSWAGKLYNTSNKMNTFAVLKCLRWPGTYIYAHQDGKKVGNIYIGHGLKHTGMSFSPQLPPLPSTEPKEPVELKDPSRVNEKRVRAGQEPIDENKVDAPPEQPAEE